MSQGTSLTLLRRGVTTATTTGIVSVKGVPVADPLSTHRVPTVIMTYDSSGAWSYQKSLDRESSPYRMTRDVR